MPKTPDNTMDRELNTSAVIVNVTVNQSALTADDSLYCPEPVPEGDFVQCITDPALLDFKTTEFQDTDYFIPGVAVYTIILLFGFLGNSFTIYVLCLSKQSTVNHFLLSLSIADALFLLLCCSYEAFFKYTGWLPPMGCQIATFLELWTALASVLNLTAVSIERYHLIVHPVRSKQLFSKPVVITLLVFVWILAALMAMPCLYIMHPYKVVFYNSMETRIHNMCLTDKAIYTKSYVVYRFVVMFAIPASVILYSNLWSVCVLWKSTLSLRRMSSSSTKTVSTDDLQTVSSFLEGVKRRPNPVSARIQTMKMFVMVLLLFSLAWCPKLIYDILYWIGGIYTQNYYILFLLMVVRYLQSALNPLIYFTMSQSIRQTAAKCCLIKCCLKLIKSAD